jgi:hypothetical protein
VLKTANGLDLEFFNSCSKQNCILNIYGFLTCNQGEHFKEKHNYFPELQLFWGMVSYTCKLAGRL